MTRSRNVWVVGCAVGLTLLVGLVVAVVAFFIPRIPDISAQLPPNAAPIMITISRPLNGSDWPLDAFVPVGVVVVSEQPITALEYWIDGVLRETQTPAADADPAHIYAQWTWVLGVEGEHSLVVRATAADGQTGTSNVIHVTAMPAVGYNILHVAEEGDTLGGLAEEHGTTPEEIASQNPGLDPGSSLSPGQQVLVPQPPFAMPPLGAPEPPAMPQGPVQPVVNAPPSALRFWLRNNLGGADSPPTAPELSYGMTGCRVDLVLVDTSDNEEGFFIYRADGEGTAFERVATLEANDDSLPLQYSDEDEGGGDHRDYYVAAFNGAGETPSNLISVDITDPACQPEGSNGIKVDGKEVILPGPMDMVYFYVSINKGAYGRFPVDPLEFLTPTDSRVSVQPVLDARLAESLPAAAELDLEVWGWTGGALTEIGRLHLSLDFTSLTICGLGKNCTGDVASTHRTTRGYVPWDKEDQEYEFYWATNVPDTTGGQWQISLQPFLEGPKPDATSLVATGHVEKTTGWRFMVDFREVAQGFPSYSACSRMTAAIYDHLDAQYPPCMLYARIIPMAGNQPAGPPSNMVAIEYGPSEPSTIEPVILDHLPNQYRVAISSFTLETQPTFATWGCVYIDELPEYQVVEDNYVAQTVAALGNVPAPFYDDIAADFAARARAKARFDYDTWKVHMDSGQPLCPLTYVAPDDDEFFLWEAASGFWDALKGVWNTAVDILNSLKAGIIDIVAKALNGLGIPCDGTCKGLLMTGLEMVISVYTGIPPSLPNFDELTDMGIDYAIEYAAAEAGIPCPDELKEALREELKGVAEGVVNSTNQRQPGCQSQDYTRQAWFKEPLCFPPGVVTTPAEGSTYEPAMVVLTVWKPAEMAPLPIAYEYHDQPAYAVKLTVTARNDHYDGKVIKYSYAFPIERLFGTEMVEFTLDVPISGEISGPVYETEIVAIPPLGPGEEVEIPVILTPARTVLPEHWSKLEKTLEAMGGMTVDDVYVRNDRQGYDSGPDAVQWKYGKSDRTCLYWAGFIKAEAEVMCLNVPLSLAGHAEPGPDSVLVPCGFEALPIQKREPSNPLCAVHEP